MKACILAAGMGTRMGSLDVPKGFLRLGSEPIVAESIARLRSVGIEEIVIVTGHLARFYEALPGVICVHNPRYADTGSLESLRCAAACLTEEFLLLESDLIYETRALSTRGVLLSGFSGAGDEVWVEARDGVLVRMSKQRMPSPTGELVGISRLTPEVFAYDGVHYEDALNAAAAAGLAIPCTLMPDLVWAEIDDAAHLERARGLYPRI